MDDEQSTSMSRRQVLKALAASAVCPMVKGCEFVEVFDDAEAPPQSEFSLDDPGLQPLQTVGETACFDHGNQPLLLVRTSEEEILAFDRICPHLDQSLGDCEGNPFPAVVDVDGGQITCQWHESSFDFDGNFVDGPDPDITGDLPTFPVEFDPATGQGTVFSP